MPEIVWTDEDEERLAALMDKYDPEKHLQGPVFRDRMPGTDWDTLIRIERARLYRQLRTAMIVSALREHAPGLWDGSEDSNEVLTGLLSDIADARVRHDSALSQLERDEVDSVLWIQAQLSSNLVSEQEAMSENSWRAEDEALGRETLDA